MHTSVMSPRLSNYEAVTSRHDFDGNDNNSDDEEVEFEQKNGEKWGMKVKNVPGTILFLQNDPQNDPQKDHPSYTMHPASVCTAYINVGAVLYVVATLNCVTLSNTLSMYNTVLCMLCYICCAVLYMQVGLERFHAPELHFTPTLSKECPVQDTDIPTMCEQSLRSVSVVSEIWPALLQNVIVQGASARLPNLGNRLEVSTFQRLFYDRYFCNCGQLLLFFAWYMRLLRALALALHNAA
jgi:hypothetical protein